MKIRKYWLYFLGLPKTLRFNFRYFPWKTAWRLPVFVSHRCYFRTLQGKIHLGKIKTGIVQIGFGEVGIFDDVRRRTVLHLCPTAEITFKGKTNIGHGSSLAVSGKLVLGDSFSISAESAIIANKEVIIGNNCLFSWDVLVMDTDFHEIYDSNGMLLNGAKAIQIGNNVWIGCRSLVLKGASIGDGSIVAASSVVPGRADVNNCIIGNKKTVDVLRKNIHWKP